MPRQSKAEIEARIAALQAELADADGGVYEDPADGSLVHRHARARAR